MAAASGSRPSRSSIKLAEIIAVHSSPRKHSSLRGNQLAPSFVRKDGIMKEVVQLEEKAKENWYTKYGFLKNTTQQFQLELQQHGITAKPEHKSSRMKKQEKISENNSQDSSAINLSQLPSTAAGMVGWLADSAQLLDVAGPLYVSPKNSLYPPNSEELFLKKQQHIVLG